MKFEAKETYYNNILFRSKNEAKWARFFDLVRIRYDYEPTTVTGWNGVRYKPDFYFPDYEKYAEVKSNAKGIHNEQMANKLNGAIEYQSTPISNGLLLLGTFPYDVRINGVKLKTKWLFWNKGVCCADACIKQKPLRQNADILFTEYRIESGSPIPASASPDIYLNQCEFGQYMTIAINATNEYFAEG